MNQTEKIGKVIKDLEQRIYACPFSKMDSLYPVVAKASKEIDNILGAEDEKIPERTNPDFLPPREDIKVRYKKEDIRREDRDDYKDTLFDPDLN